VLVALVLPRRLRGRRFGSGAAHATPAAGSARVRLWQKLVVMAVFTTTVLLWLSEPWTGLPTAVVSFLPIVALSMVGVIQREDIRALPWDILILLAGGLSLGVGVAESGLAGWLAHKVAAIPAAPWVMALALCYLTSALSNLMSNTAAANLILPVAIALGLELGGPLLAAQLAVPIALAASSAMCLPISTPPNAIVHATGDVARRDLIGGGVLVGLLAPPVAVGWCFPVLDWLAGLRGAGL
jgi:sodium-dependent dicarboxylate transporter 2/3/5